MVNVRPGEGVFENNDFQKKKKIYDKQKKKKNVSAMLFLFFLMFSIVIVRFYMHLLSIFTHTSFKELGLIRTRVMNTR